MADGKPAARRPFIHAWFVLDAVLALMPPLYWFADGRTTPILGVPGALFYFLAVCTCITASLLAAHFTDPERHA